MITNFDIRGVQGRRWASVTISDLTGGAGLGYFQLNLNLNLHVEAASDSNDPSSANTPFSLTALLAEIRLGPSLLGVATATQQSVPVIPHSFTSDPTVQLRLDLDRRRLEAIEAARDGKDMSLALMIYAQLTDSAGPPRWETQTAAYVVSQSTWVQFLEQVSYRKTLLLEIPVPPKQRSPELAAASAELERAQKAIERGDYRDAVGYCRDVMENILRALKDTDLIDFTNTRSMDKADRLRLLRRAFRTFTHPAKHSDDVAVAIEWNRVDAVSAISISAALLNELTAPGAR